jgi:hypothetical protein
MGINDAAKVVTAAQLRNTDYIPRLRNFVALFVPSQPFSSDANPLLTMA